ncbi:unnamed protein product [marine sediment metagenome]|uniref:Uncharacterized protein n=1 Tax=marine sediment metagenome TaxID=412755 RepID=X1HRA4_9ZZZZ
MIKTARKSELEKKIRIFYECFKKEIDLDDFELIKESRIVNGVLKFPSKRKPKFRDIGSFSNEITDKK